MDWFLLEHLSEILDEVWYSQILVFRLISDRYLISILYWDSSVVCCLKLKISHSLIWPLSWPPPHPSLSLSLCPNQRSTTGSSASRPWRTSCAASPRKTTKSSNTSSATWASEWESELASEGGASDSPRGPATSSWHQVCSRDRTEAYSRPILGACFCNRLRRLFLRRRTSRAKFFLPL